MSPCLRVLPFSRAFEPVPALSLAIHLERGFFPSAAIFGTKEKKRFFGRNGKILNFFFVKPLNRKFARILIFLFWESFCPFSLSLSLSHLNTLFLFSFLYLSLSIVSPYCFFLTLSSMVHLSLSLSPFLFFLFSMLFLVFINFGIFDKQCTSSFTCLD